MQLSKTSLLLALLQFLPSILGQTACTQSNALSYPAAGTSDESCSDTAIANDDTGCVRQYCQSGGTSASLNACFCLAGIGENCGSTRTRELKTNFLEKRDGFTCSSSETCYINSADGGLFCLDKTTGDYVGESGDSGNLDTGAYTPASGEGTTAVGAGSTATSTNSDAAITQTNKSAESAASTRAGTSTSTSAMSSSSSRTRTPSSATSSTMTSTSATVASTKSSAGVGKAKPRAVVGALAWIVGLGL